MENSSMVAHLSLNLLYVVWRHVAIARNFSVDLSATLLAHFNIQLLHYVKFESTDVDPIVFVGGKAL
jgi:hypothetical protein